MANWRRLAAVAAIMLILTNGPVFLFAKRLLDRPGHWEDPAVWPFFAIAAAASVALAWSVPRKRSGRPRDRRQPHSLEERSQQGLHAPCETSRDRWQQLAVVAVAWFTAAALASTLWSVDSAATGWRSAVYIGLAALAWVIANSRLNEIAAMLMLVAGTAVVSSLIVVALWPDAGLDDNGAWRGTYTNRNSLAPLAAIALIASLRFLLGRPEQALRQSARPAQTAAHPRNRRAKPTPAHSRYRAPITLNTHAADAGPQADDATRAERRGEVPPLQVSGQHNHSGAQSRGVIRVGAGLLAGLSVVAMLGAGSRTAWIALAAASSVAALPVARHAVRKRWGAAAARLLTAATGAACAVVTVLVATALWDTPTFAQRREMWSLVWERILERPLAGHGFFTFWDIEELTLHVLLRRGSAHNSLMEVGLGLGLLGAVPFMLVVVLAFRSAGLSVWHRPNAQNWMWAAVVGFVIIENVAESFVLWFSYNWVLLMAAALLPSPRRAPQRHRDQARREHQ